MPIPHVLILRELVSDQFPGCVRRRTRREVEDTVAI